MISLYIYIYGELVSSWRPAWLAGAGIRAVHGIQCLQLKYNSGWMALELRDWLAKPVQSQVVPAIFENNQKLLCRGTPHVKG